MFFRPALQFTTKPALIPAFLCAAVCGLLLYSHSWAGSPASPVSSSPFTASWITFGDSGSGAPDQFKLASQMNALAEKKPVNAVLIVGDIIYPEGDVAQFGESRYKLPYKTLMAKGIPFVDVLGNHDVVRDHVQKKLDFYHMPGRYYQYDLGQTPACATCSAVRPLVSIFVIDSNQFSNDKLQQTWLNQKLSESSARWKVVAGHHPVYTSGAHAGEADLKALKKTLEPILVKNHVPLYLCGHDHDYERFTPVQGVQYIVSGGGGAYLRKFQKVPTPGSLVRQSVYHFLYLSANASQIHIQAIDESGKVIDQINIQHP